MKRKIKTGKKSYKNRKFKLQSKYYKRSILEKNNNSFQIQPELK